MSKSSRKRKGKPSESARERKGSQARTQKKSKSTERVHELEELKVIQASETESIASTREEMPLQILLKSVMQKFDLEKSDMTLFLRLF